MKEMKLFKLIISMECDAGKMITDEEMEDLVTGQMNGILDNETNLENIGVSVMELNK